MKNFFINILLLATFSASLFAADETKANDVLTAEIQLELAVLYGAFNIACYAAGHGSWDEALSESTSDDGCDARVSAWDDAGDETKGVVGAAVEATATVAAQIAALNAVWDAAGYDAMDAARAAGNRAKTAAISSWIFVIRKLPDIKEEIKKRTEGMLLGLTPQEPVKPYSSLIKSFNKSFKNLRYARMLDAIKTLYVVSLAIIFPNAGFEKKVEFIAYTNNVGALIRDPLDLELLYSYVLAELDKLEAELKQEPKLAS